MQLASRDFRALNHSITLLHHFVSVEFGQMPTSGAESRSGRICLDSESPVKIIDRIPPRLDGISTLLSADTSPTLSFDAKQDAVKTKRLLISSTKIELNFNKLIRMIRATLRT